MRSTGCARYSPRITPEDSAIATETAVIMASRPTETDPSASCERPRKIESPGSSGTIAETTRTSVGTRSREASG